MGVDLAKTGSSGPVTGVHGVVYTGWWYTGGGWWGGMVPGVWGGTGSGASLGGTPWYGSGSWFLPDLAVFCRIWPDLAVFCRIWPDFA